MRKFLKNLLVNILIILLMVFGVVIALIYRPKESVSWVEKISSSVPEEYSVMSDERKNLLKEFDDFVLSSATEGSKKIVELVFSKQYKLDWMLERSIIDELNEDVADDSLKLWYVYNMGVVAKTADTVVCFDLSTVVATPNLLKIAESCDYLVISHGDGDHFSPLVVKMVLDSGGKVFVQEETGILGEAVRALASEKEKENVYDLDEKAVYNVDSISLYALKTKHRMEEEKDNAWFSVNVNGFNIVHTGDGLLNDSNEWDLFEDIDVLLTNTIVQPLDLRDSGARYIIPLHMHELGHNREFLEQNSFTAYFEKLDGFEEDISSKIYPLLWSESIVIGR